MSLRRKLFDVSSQAIHAASKRVHRRFIKTNDIQTSVSCEEYTPKGNWEGTLLYLHGGGYMIGSPKSYRTLGMRIADEAKCRVIIPDYRLAPEHPFPSGLYDAVEVYKEILKFEKPENIYIAGDSAGGGLSTALALYLRDNNLPLPGCVTLMSPFLDVLCKGKSWKTNKDRDQLFSRDDISQLVRHYYKNADPQNPLVSPLNADLAGLPRFLILVGSYERLLSDSENFYEKLKAAGGTAELQVWPEMQHVWPFLAPFGKESLKSINSIAGFILGEKFHHSKVPIRLDEAG
jgi:acetyl esterase/lipase